MEISLCMIVKNEEDNLGNCLESVHDLVEEIVIVDTGSTDKTKEIAAKYTDKIYDFEWIDDFSAARNFAFSKGTKRYLMWLDADDILTEENRVKFRKMKDKLKYKYDVILMEYQLTRGGKVTSRFMRERIIRRSLNLQWKSLIHEYIDSTKVPKKLHHVSEVAVTHTKEHRDENRNFLILQEAIEKGSTDSVILYYYAMELALRSREDEAIKYFEQFFKLDELRANLVVNACFMLHRLYMKAERHTEAIQLSKKWYDVCKNSSEYCCQLGEYYFVVENNANESINWYKRAAACVPQEGNNALTQAKYYYYIPYHCLSRIYESLGRLEEAKKCLQIALGYLKQLRGIEDFEPEFIF